MKRRKGRKPAGLLIAAAGAAIVVQATPLYIWYIALAGLILLLVLVIFMG